MNSSTRELPAWSPDLLASLAGAPNLGTAARHLARAGVPVFPCVPLGKQPLTRRGFLDASTDLGRVAQWWDRWPEANIAMPTGAPSGIVVVDVDVHASGSGFDAFERASSAGLVDGWAWMVRTPLGWTTRLLPLQAGRGPTLLAGTQPARRLPGRRRLRGPPTVPGSLAERGHRGVPRRLDHRPPSRPHRHHGPTSVPRTSSPGPDDTDPAPGHSQLQP